MAVRIGHIGYEFVFPKLHGMWAKSVWGERLEALIRANSLDTLGRVLGPRDVQVHSRQDVQKRLVTHFLNDLDRVRGLLKARVAALYTAVIRISHFENLKTILHARYATQPSDIRDLLIVSPHLPDLPVRQLLDARTVNQFYGLLPADDLRSELLPILVELDETRDFVTAEGRIDRLHFDEMIAACCGMHGRLGDLAREFVGTEIDIENLVLLLRNFELYNLPAERLNELFLPHGRLLSADDLRELSQAGARDTAVERVPAGYRRVIERLGDRPLYEQENALWCELCSRAYDAFQDFNHMMDSVVAFPYLKRFETMNLARLFEGFYLKLPPSTIRSMLIGGSHVSA